jgi:rhodanese-related sulfurtransferase
MKEEDREFPMEMDPAQALEFLQANPSTTLLDVREVEENAYCALKGSLLIPLNSLSEALSYVDEKKAVVAYCHHGIRSLAAVRMLREKGFTKATSLRGGIDLWSTQIDPSVPRY